MSAADFLPFLRSRENLALPVLTGFAAFVALAVGLLTLNGYVSPGGAQVFAALLCALAAAWYARGFFENRIKNDSVALIFSASGWALATLAFFVRAFNSEARAAAFLAVGAILLILAGFSLEVASLLAGNNDASTRGSKKDLGDALRDVRDL